MYLGSLAGKAAMNEATSPVLGIDACASSCPSVVLLKRADERQECRLLGVDRKRAADGLNEAISPLRTWAAGQGRLWPVGMMARPVYPQARKYPCVLALTLFAQRRKFFSAKSPRLTGSLYNGTLEQASRGEAESQNP